MRILVLSDIHANLDALDAVLDAVADTPYDRLLVLGDLVGYGANPNEVVDRIFALGPHTMIRGNHDKVACGIEEPTHFNEVAAAAARWTLQTLTDANRDRVATLPAGPAVVDDTIEVCHGTPYDEDVYVFSEAEVIRSLDETRRPLCLFGHTHVPIGFSRHTASGLLDAYAPQIEATPTLALTLDDDHRYLVNPGSVGQPRDGDPRAAFAVYETDTRCLEIARVPYRVDLAQEKIIEAGLPESLARRLGVGR